MASNDKDFLKKLISTFRAEAHEHIASITHGLTELETAKGGARAAAIESIFRETHSLKGAARTVNLRPIEALCQSMENVLAAAKRSEVMLRSDSVDILLLAVDRVRGMLKVEFEEQPPSPAAGDDDLIRKLDGIVASGTPSVNPDLSAGEARSNTEEETTARNLEPALSNESVRVSVDRLEGILHEAETLRMGRSAIVALVDSIQDVVAECEQWRRAWNRLYPTIRTLEKNLGNQPTLLSRSTIAPNPADSGHDVVPQARRVFDFFDWNQAFMVSLEDRLRSLQKTAFQSGLPIMSTSDLLLNETLEALMLPVSYLTDALPPFVRRLSRDQSKEVDLKLEGTDVALDRRLLQVVKDPVVHLLRNCVDHGLEKPAERAASGKPTRGAISIVVVQKGSGRVEIRVSDDGRGIDVDRVKESAVKLDLVTSEAASTMRDEDALAFVFRSGFSTSPNANELSGRGLGLAIVREKVEGIGGSVAVETSVGEGTTFRLDLPTAMSTLRVVIVRCGKSFFMIPTVNVERVAALPRQSVKTIENYPTILLDGQTVPVAPLSRIVGLLSDTDEGISYEKLTFVVVRFAGERIGFQVDEVLDEQEVLEKSLGPHLQGLQGLSGVAVTATGKVLPVLDVSDLIKSTHVDGATGEYQAKEMVKNEPETASILVVEDSITARSLMKNILEGAGFRVDVAVDGIDGFTKLKEGAFDLVVSDVEMPRMNGFDLTARIRGDKRIGDLPVVLVTALESPQDRERGIEVGANAYIVKSSFENSSLIEIVQQLV